ncbi:DUF6279 family lipoprotein [Motilimonas sp. KMU-193]|uniref:DUF6279 family lipoprotein n=1 Tax=Motilimonas sp. KMU-193 TaxID=3388668 RepID=UPI00396B2854
MEPKGRKVTRYLISLILALFLVGCSTQFTYNNLSWLVYWYLDDYVELTSEQRKVFDQKLYAFQLWHRYNELPRYQSHLDELIKDVNKGPLTLARIEYHHQAFIDHWQRLKQKAVPELVAMAPMLSQQQVDQLFAALTKKNHERTDEIVKLQSAAKDKQLQVMLDERLEGISEWVGKLSPQQKLLVSQANQDYFDNRLLWLQYRARYQNELKNAFSSAGNSDVLQARLTQLLLKPEPLRGQPLQQQHSYNVKVYHQFLVELGQSLTPTQRQHLSAKIMKYHNDFNALALN